MFVIHFAMKKSINKDYILYLYFSVWLLLFIQNTLLSNRHLLHRIWKNQ